MLKYSLNNNWQVTEGSLRNPLMMNMLDHWQECSLPHDFQITKDRDPNSLTEDNEGWTQGAAVFYKKEFLLTPEAEKKRCWIEFEGIAGVCEIWVNGKYVAKHMNPYTGVLTEVTEFVHIGENMIQVHVDSRMKPNSRWYVGTGLYRRVWLHLSEQATILPESLHICTKTLEGNRAILDIRGEVSGRADRVTFRVKDRAGKVYAESEAALREGYAEAEVEVCNIVPWCPDMPVLYLVEAGVWSGEIVDTTTVRTGIRIIEVNSKEGFRLNGVSMKLKGGCIHHDLGLLGAAEYEAANRRRVKILMENGYNALRGAHNPFGPSFYEVCDELGMLVIEEAFDEWVLGRTDFGQHITFEDRWERDLEDMIRRDYNHPSIIMWSTGNEVEERDGSADGYAWSRRLADKVRSLDSTRPVSASACSLFIEYTQRPGLDVDESVTGNQALNMAYDTFAEGRDLWGPATAEYFAPLDVAGYNYKTARYAYDGEKYPDRVIYGSESYPRAAFQSWLATEENSHVIGDFVWTAWDYIGEVGVGRWEVSDEARPGPADYPWLLANCSDMDLLGRKRPQSYYRDVVWGCSGGPKLFCLPPELTGRKIARLSWGWLPVRHSYTFAGQEGQDMEVHVYANAEEVELFQNGVSMGKKPCGKQEEFIAVFTIPYRCGRLEVIAYENGLESGRDILCTAGETAKIELQLDHPMILADGQDLAFLTIQAVDANGNPVFDEKGEVSVKVLGSGTLLALGSADPRPDCANPYGLESCQLFEGTAMAIIRSDVGAKGCLVEVTLHGDITAQIPIGYSAVCEKNVPVQDMKPGVLDLPLEKLLENDGTMAVLRRIMGSVLDSPMLNSMKGLSLKKLTAMGGQTIPLEIAGELEQIMK